MQNPAEVQKVLGELFRSMWGLTAFTVAIERGLLAALGVPRSIAELAQHSGMQPTTVRATLDVLASLGFVLPVDEKFAAAPGLSAVLAGGGELLHADLRSTLGQFMHLFAEARHPARPIEGWRATDPRLVEAQAIVSEGA